MVFGIQDSTPAKEQFIGPIILRIDYCGMRLEGQSREVTARGAPPEKQKGGGVFRAPPQCGGNEAIVFRLRVSHGPSL